MSSKFLRTCAASFLIGSFLLAGVTSCGSSGGSDAAPSDPATTAGEGSSDGSTDGSTDAPKAADADPCQWYTAAEMSDLVGFEVTAKELETPQALGAECLYDSSTDAVGITVRPTTAATYDQLKAGAASTGLGGDQIEISGIGDEAYHNGAPDKANPSVSLNAKQGDDGIQVEIAAASSGGIASIDDSIEIASAIATKALG